MRLKEYIKELKELEKQYGDVDLYYAVDIEGNAYERVIYSPSVYYLNKSKVSIHGSVDPDDIQEEKTHVEEEPIIIIN